MPPKHAVSYELNDKILCKYGDLYYEGKIVNVSTLDGGRVFTVHYQGWHKRHDATIPESKSRELFLPYTDENIARAKAELEAARLERKRKSKSVATSDPTTSSTLSLSPIVTTRRGKVVKKESVLDVNSIKYYYGRLPQSLRGILDKDCDAVIRRRLLTKLPAAYPIDVLLMEFMYTYDIDMMFGEAKVTVSYGDDISCSHLNTLMVASQMITDYFNMLLGKVLLYPPERDQYQSELLRQRLLNLNGTDGSEDRPHIGSTVLPDKTIAVRHSSVYGLPHLLRLFNYFSKKFADPHQDSDAVLKLKLMTSEFVTFLDENREKYFSVRRDYEPQE